jgi:hypothetical protein
MAVRIDNVAFPLGGFAGLELLDGITVGDGSGVRRSYGHASRGRDYNGATAIFGIPRRALHDGTADDRTAV